MKLWQYNATKNNFNRLTYEEHIFNKLVNNIFLRAKPAYYPGFIGEIAFHFCETSGVLNCHIYCRLTCGSGENPRYY